jgi:uncharacterized membrane protein YhhN
VWAAVDLPARNAWLYAFKPAATALLCGGVLSAARSGSSTRYAGAIAAGLAASLAGDAFLMLPSDLFLAGLLAFLIAHLCYLIAFTADVGLAERRLPFVVYAALGATLLAVLWRSASPRVAVVVYSSALCAMAAQALARWQVLRTPAAALAAAGAAVFVVSDSLLAMGRFRGPVPHGGVWVLATYYLAQTLIAISAMAPIALGYPPTREQR